jgi:hypothetical protein
MVHVRDEGARFEGSVETVWRYMNSGAPHAAAHRSERNREVKSEGGHTMVASMERHWRGQWVKVVERITVMPPLGMLVEVLGGPFQGTKQFTVYTPNGSSTQVDVFGDFRSPTIPEDQIETAAREWLDEEFREDAPAIQRMQNTSEDSGS